MGTVPDWVRANHKKNGYADGGEIVAEESKPSKLDLTVNGGGSGDGIKNFGMGGRAALRKELSDDSSVELGATGHAARWSTNGKSGRDYAVDGVDVTYRKGDTSVSVGRVLNNTNQDMGTPKPGNKGWTFNITKEFANGGKVKAEDFVGLGKAYDELEEDTEEE